MPVLARAARNARAEAQEVAGPGADARVLEPSPPAVKERPWFADDPTVGDGTGAVIAPVAGRGRTWDEWLADRPAHQDWASARWLGAFRRLGSPPAGYEATRQALHRLAVYVVSPARRRANGKLALRFTFGGFGTPFFGADEQVRVEGTDLVHQVGGRAQVWPITTLARAAGAVLEGPPDAEWAGHFDVPPAGDVDEDLAVGPEAAAFLGDWYGFGYSVLEELRADAASADASRVQLWPEHFDCAFECLPDAERRRAGFGASPGDAAVPEPYLYVVPWHSDDVPASELWNATSFRGGILRLSEFAGAPD
ncbi:MAG: hypothetical protein ACRD0M_03375, partial [Acidimicrobiales bacterium]